MRWLRGYRRAWLRFDLVAGIAAGAVVVPQAMAYATIADLPVEVGLYTCMAPMAVYAVLGGSRVLSASTTSTIATLTASTLAAAGVAGSVDDLATLVLLTGVALLAARLLRLGPLVENISEAIVIGLKVGVGLSVAAGQLPELLGIPPTRAPTPSSPGCATRSGTSPTRTAGRWRCRWRASPCWWAWATCCRRCPPRWWRWRAASRWWP